MLCGQYTNYLQLAAALSLAGWVARTPDSQFDPAVLNNHYTQDARYHPYANRNQGGYNQQNAYNFNQVPMVQQGLPANYNPENSQNFLYQSKEAQESFRSYMELQELISWQEAYRRGDFQLGNQPQVLPVTKKKEDNNLPFNNANSQISPRPSSDDGYDSASIGSPASTVFSSDGVTRSSFDENINHWSIANNLFDSNEFENLQGASGFTPSPNALDLNDEFNIDEIINFDYDKDPMGEKELAQLDSARRPFANLKSVDGDLEYVNSPLKSPTSDEFIASPMPGNIPPISSFHDRSFDDPFSMQFTNSSGGDKMISDTLLELGEFDPSAFANAAADEDIDRELVASLSKKSTIGAGASLLPLASIKKEFPLGEHYQHDHAYHKPGFQRDTQKWLPNKSRVPYSVSDLVKFTPQPNGLSSPSYDRTFASSSRFTKPKQQKRKDPLIWSDFQYSSDELVNMPVEMFNDVISKLDEVRQHVAKDIRRKGKNKLAARTCRKRKMDIIESLDYGVGTLEQQRAALLEERQKLIDETKQIRDKTEWLNAYIFEHLRDSNGSPYSASDYSLQYTSDGNVYLVPSNQKSSPTKVEV